jgi:uncharacterized lipoprotein YmbA
MKRRRLFGEMEGEACAAAHAGKSCANDSAGADVRELGARASGALGGRALGQARVDARGVGSARAAVAVATVLAVVGCASSAPLRFYTLSAVPPAGAEAAGATGAAAIRVGRVRIPAELDRTEIVQRVDANRLNIGELDRWAAPMEDMVRRVLTADLQSRAGATAQGKSPATLNVDIEEFIGDASCNVTLTASWELKAADAPVTARESIRIPGSGSNCPPSSLPMPMSQALAQLSEKIVAPR